MSWNSSELLSEDTQSDQEGPPSSPTKPSFSFHRYLDEVTGDGSSDSEDDLSRDSGVMGGVSYDRGEDQEGGDGGSNAVALTVAVDESDESRTVDHDDDVTKAEQDATDMEIDESDENVKSSSISPGDETSKIELQAMTEVDVKNDSSEDADMKMAPELEEEVPKEEQAQETLDDKIMAKSPEKEKNTELEMESMDNISPGTVQSPPHVHVRSTLPTFPRTPQRTPSTATTSILSPSQKNTKTPPSIKRVRMSPLTKTIPSKRPLKTPPRRSQQSQPQSQSQSQSQSKRPKIISPFSPRARRMRLHSQNLGQQNKSASKAQFSMAPSRKVSILVNISPHLNAPITSNDEENTLCLYPNVAVDDGAMSSTNVSVLNSPTRSIKSSYSVTSEMSILNKAGPGQEIILVNPTAFDEVIPTSVTVETARVVQHFSNIVSEDWVRKYRFDEVCWPGVKQLIGIKKQTTNATMEDISRAAVADALDGGNAVLFGYGVFQSGRMESMFGSIAGDGIDPLNTLRGRTSIGLELGLLGLSASALLDKQTGDMSEMTFKITMVEILQDNVLRDLLMEPKDASKESESALKIRHPDMNGAIIENATELSITTLADLKIVVRRAFHSRYNLKARKMVGGRGHVIADIHVFPKGEQKVQKGQKKDCNYTLLKLVDLACAQTEQMDQESVAGRSKLEMTKVQNRRVACIRKSMAGLGALLRGQVVHQARHMPQSTLYRACTLTKLVQRALDNEKSRSIMISTVCPRRDSYESTLHTLNFMHKLLVRPSKTAESPFDTKGNEEFEGQSIGGFFSPGDYSVANSVAQSVASSVASEAIRSEFAHVRGTRAFMKSLVTDPRQRLATLLSPKESSSGAGYHGGVPMQEITTIKEVGNDIDEEDHYDTRMADLKSFQDESSNQSGLESLDSTIVEKSVDKSHSKVSILSDEISFEENQDEDSGSGVLSSEGTDSTKRNGTFDQVLDQLDEIDAYNEGDSEYLVSVDESSVDSLEPLGMSNASNDDNERSEDVMPLRRREDPPDDNDVLTDKNNIDEVYASEQDLLPTTGATNQNNLDENENVDTPDGSEEVENSPNSAEPPVESRPDPVGVTADEITVQSPYRAAPRAPQPVYYAESVNGETSSNEDVIEYSDFAQSMISTLTMTRQSSDESFPDVSTEESFARTSSHDDLSEESYPRDDEDDDESFGAEESHEIQSDETSREEASYPSNKETEGHGRENIMQYDGNQETLTHDKIHSASRSTPASNAESEGFAQSRSFSGTDDDAPHTRNDGEIRVSSDDKFVETDSSGDRIRRDDVSSRVTGNFPDDVGRSGRVSVTQNPLNDLHVDSSEEESFIDTRAAGVTHSTHQQEAPNNNLGGEHRRGIDPDAFVEKDVYHKRVVQRILSQSSTQRSAKLNSSPEPIPRSASAILSDYEFNDPSDQITHQQSLPPRKRYRHHATAGLLNEPTRRVKPSNPTAQPRNARIDAPSTSVQDQDQDTTLLRDGGVVDASSAPAQVQGQGRSNVARGGSSSSHEDDGNDEDSSIQVQGQGADAQAITSTARGLDQGTHIARGGSSSSHHDQAVSALDPASAPLRGNQDTHIAHGQAGVSDTISQPRNTRIDAPSTSAQNQGRSNVARGGSSSSHEDYGNDEDSSIQVQDQGTDVRVDAFISDVKEEGTNIARGGSSSSHHQAVSALDPTSAPLRDQDTNIDISSTPIESLQSNVETVEIESTSESNRENRKASSMERIQTKEKYYESPTRRRVKKSVIKKVQSLVGESNAFRAYSPDRSVDAKKSLEHYKTMLEESLKALDGEMEGSSVGILLDQSDEEFGDENAISREWRLPSDIQQSQANTPHDLAYLASDASSSDGNSMDFDELPAKDATRTEEESPSQQQRLATNRVENKDSSETLEKELKSLKESLKRCVESTNESEVISELVEDKFDIAESFNPYNGPDLSREEDPIVRTVQLLTYQTEALQTFISTTVDQLQESRGAKRDGQLELLDMNSRLEETLDEIQNLKSSNDRSLDQIRQDHLGSMNSLKREAEQDKELESERRQKSAMQEKYSQEQRRLTSALSTAEREKEHFKQNISSMNDNVEELKKRLDKTMADRKKDNDTHAEELASLVKALDRNDVNQEQQAETHRLNVQALETRFAEQKELTKRAEDDLQARTVSFSEQTDRYVKDRVAQSSIKDELLDMKARLAEESTSKQSSIARLEEEVAKKNRKNDELSDAIKSMKSELEERLVSEKVIKENETILRERLAAEERDKDALEDRLTDEINSFQTSLNAKNKQNDELLKTLKSAKTEFEENFLDKDSTQARLTERIITLQRELDLKNGNCTDLEQRLETLQSDHEDRSKSEQSERISLQERIARLESELQDATVTNDSLEDNAKEQVSTLQREIDQKNSTNSDLGRDLELLKKDYDELLNLKTMTETTFEEKITVLEQQAAEEASTKKQAESDLLEKLSILEEDIKNKADTIEKLQNASSSTQSEYEKCLKMEGIEKMSLEEEIATLQERLREEAQEKDAMEANFSKKNTILKSELDCKSRSEQELQDALDTLQSKHGALVNQLGSEEKENKSLKEAVESLQHRVAEESDSKDDLKTRLSHQRSSHDEELERHRHVVGDLSDRLQIAEDACADAESRLETKNVEIASLTDKLSEFQDHFDEAMQLKEEEETRLSQRLAELKKLLEEKSTANVELSNNVESLKREQDILQEKLAAGVNEIMEAKSSFEAQVSSLKSKLDHRNKEKKSFEDKISSLRKDNGILKEEMNMKAEELTSELARIEQEKASHEAAKSGLENSLKERSKENKHLLEEVSKHKNKFSELEDRLSSEIKERNLQEDEYLRRIEFLENSLNDCGKSKEELKERIRILEEEVERLKKTIEGNSKLQAGDAKKIASLERLLAEKMEGASQLQDSLSRYEKEVSSLNKVLSEMSRENSEATRIHTEKIITLTHTIREKEELMVDQTEDIAALQEEIKHLDQKFKEENETKIKSEQSHIAEVMKLKEFLSKKAAEMQKLSSQSSEQRLEIDTIQERLAVEMEEKNKLMLQESKLQNTLELFQADIADLHDKLQVLQDDMSKSKKRTESEANQKEKALSALNNLEVAYKKDKVILQDTLLSKREETQNLSDKILSMVTSLNEKDNAIGDLQSTVVELTATLETETIKVQTLYTTKNTTEEEKSKLLEERDSLVKRFTEEMESKISEVDKLRHSLESKASKNKKLKELLANACSDKDKVEKAAEESLEESRAANTDLLDTLTRTKEDLKAKIRELEEEKNQHDIVTDSKLESLSMRISDLSIVKETLQSENTSLMQTIDEEKKSSEKLAKKNKLLRSAMSDNEKQLRDQMNELGSTMHLTISKIESKRKKAIVEEREHSKIAIEKLEDENDDYKIKIARLESAVRQLERHITSDVSGNDSNVDNAQNESTNNLREENDRLRRRIETFEHTQSSSYTFSERRRGTPGHSDSPVTPIGTQVGDGNKYYSNIYRSERDRRLKAEEFAAAMAARAKAGFEKKNEEIVGLQMHITTLEAEKENIQNHQQRLMLVDGGNGNSGTLALTMQERDEALEEARKYRSIAKKLNRQVITMGQQLELFEGDNYVIEDESLGGDEVDNFGV
jgi:chromosome segregation ATPase